LVHYWELERITGLMKHNHSFFNSKDALKMIEELISNYSLSLHDIMDIWGTPGLNKNSFFKYNSLDIFSEYTYHSISHLFSAILMNTDVFKHNTVIGIGLAVDGGPDIVVDVQARSKKFYAGCISENGKIKDIFHISSPAILWSFARNKYHLEQGSHMALASASSCTYLLDFPDVEILDDYSSAKKAYNWFINLHQTIEKIDDCDSGRLFTGFDERFSREENRISMVM